MLSYLFLIAVAATSVDLPSTDITDQDASSLAESSKDRQELEELVTVLMREEPPLEVVANSDETIPTESTVVLATTPITITNAIEPSMLEYKHWTGKYSPDTFSISVNGTQIEQGKTVEVPAATKTVDIRYDYSFVNGMKVGGRTISYELNENITQANISFSWKDDWRVMVDNGVAVKEITA
jgi:hypothetical protein